MVENELMKKLNEDMKNAMKSGNQFRLDTLRMLKSGWQKIVIEKQDKITPDDELAFFQAESKRRKEAIEQYTKGGRLDLAEKEQKEMEIIAEFLPKPLSEEELIGIIRQTLQEVNPQSVKDMGKVMGALMPRIKGKADGKKAQEIVKQMIESR